MNFRLTHCAVAASYPIPAIKGATFSRVRVIDFVANRKPTSNLNVDPEDHPRSLIEANGQSIGVIGSISHQI
jgi:hypothetical protein